MGDTLKVQAVEGRMLPVYGKAGAFVGYERVRAKKDADINVPGGASYKLSTATISVPNDSYYRRALRRGDLSEVGKAKKKTTGSSSGSGSKE